MSLGKKGEGGTIVLKEILVPMLKSGRQIAFVTMLAFIGISLLIGDGVITPAISILSAVEGSLLIPGFENAGQGTLILIPGLISIILFSFQTKGTEKFAKAFGPLMLLWFVSLIVSGLLSIIKFPVVLNAVNSYYAIHFLYENGITGFFILSEFILCATGGEALFAALAAALVASSGLRVVDKRWPAIQEPLIGSLFVLAASLAILLAASDPHGSEQLRDVLAGQILWVTGGQVGIAALAMAIALAVWRRWHGKGWAFYVAFAICITQAVQLVGVYLVFASLIFPALAVRRQAIRPALLRGYGIGVIGCLTGLVCSALFDLPPGAIMVVTLAIAALALARWGDRHGK